MGAEFASRVAAAQAMSKPAAAPAAKPAAAAEAPAQTESAEAEGSDASEGAEQPESGATESPDTGSSEGESTETLSLEERVEAAGKALEKGDLKGLAKALGKDIKVPDGSLRAFRSLARRENKLKADREKWEKEKTESDGALEKAKREIAEDSAKNSRLLRHVEQKYGWIPQAEQAWDQDDMVTVSKAISRLCKGASIATITQRLAGVKTTDTPPPKPSASPDPEKEQLKARNAELERKETEREKAQKEQTTAARRDERMADFGKALAKHPFLANPDEPGKVDPDALKEAFAAYEACWDGNKFTKTARQVVDELHARELRRIKRLGLAPAAKAEPSARPNPDKKPTPPTKRLPEPPPTKNGKPPSQEDTRAHRIALARRMSEQQQRGMR